MHFYAHMAMKISFPIIVMINVSVHFGFQRPQHDPRHSRGLPVHVGVVPRALLLGPIFLLARAEARLLLRPQRKQEVPLWLAR